MIDNCYLMIENCWLILNQEREEFDGRTGMFQVKMLFVIFFRCWSLRQIVTLVFLQICEKSWPILFNYRVNTARATPTWMGRGSTRRRLSSPSCYWPSCLSNSTSRFPTLGYLSCGTISFQIPPPLYYTPPSEPAAILANPATNSSTPSLYDQFTVVFIHNRIDHTAAGWERRTASVGRKKLENLVLVADYAQTASQEQPPISLACQLASKMSWTAGQCLYKHCSYSPVLCKKQNKNRAYQPSKAF